MKLQFFIHGLTGGGAERVLTTVANNLAAKDNEIQIILTSSINNPVFELDSRIKISYLRESRKFRAPLFEKLFNRLSFVRRVRNYARNFKPDVVVSFLTPLNNDILLAMLGLHYPILVCEHSTVTRYYGFITNLQRKLLYPLATGITVLTKRDFDLWKGKYKNVFLLPNPCDFCLEPTVEKKEKTILAVGRVYQWKIKGFDTLIKCWDKLSGEFPDWKCQIAGAYSDNVIDELKKVTSEEAVNKIEFLGFRNDVRQLMLNSEIFCMTSRIEGLPMVLIEAMISGCCCISYDTTTGPSDIIDNGNTGVLVEDQNEEQFIEKLRELLCNKELRNYFSKNAPESMKCFSTESVIMIWEEILNKVSRYNER